MATISETILSIRDATNCNLTSLKQRAKLLVQADELTSIGRGSSAAVVNSDDCAKLLLVVLLNGQSSTIVKRIKNIQKYKFTNYVKIDDAFRKLIPEKYENLNIVRFLSLIILDMSKNDGGLFPQISNISLTRENFGEGKENYIEKIYINFKNENENFDVIFSSHYDEEEEKIRKSYLETWSDVTHRHVRNYKEAPVLVKSCRIPGGIFENLAFCSTHSDYHLEDEYKNNPLAREKRIQETLASASRIPWEREECILVLDLYLTNPKSPPRKESKEVIELTKILKRRWYLKNRQIPQKKFRNVNGVYMFMCNFRNLDPEIKGGLKPPSYTGVKVWNEFYDNQENLRKEANKIKNTINEDYKEKKNEDNERGEQGLRDEFSHWVPEDELDQDEDLELDK